jgi:glycine reductase
VREKGAANVVAEVELRGKKVIALGERDGVPAPAIAACARAAGAEVVLEETYCFV